MTNEPYNTSDHGMGKETCPSCDQPTNTGGSDQLFDSLATEKEVRDLLVEVGLQANEHGLADFAVDQMFEDARSKLRRIDYDRSQRTRGENMATSALGAASTDCPACGETFKLHTQNDDQRYVRHLEGHLKEDKEDNE